MIFEIKTKNSGSVDKSILKADNTTKAIELMRDEFDPYIDEILSVEKKIITDYSLETTKDEETGEEWLVAPILEGSDNNKVVFSSIYSLMQ